ncbi:hypothetical protein A2V68_03060 [candidate division Kazan bacterium RBG_13_50_9]|uniref:PEP-utilising enzyme mobile domain-containing protein n=1 Tax=candidate division Kazan bacterium RBG_13_50_9 TaxID=1798535 RepID=A0A1F4NSY9_UNCK3|nr:MAG: hypothetical protein A2V68_03060 [candidate division Kazan bacterium RBG_13_50_9]
MARQKSLKQDNLEEAWVREFPLTSASLFGANFCIELKRILGKGLKQALFMYQNGQTTAYKGRQDGQLFSRYYGQKVRTSPQFAKALPGELIRLSDQVIRFTKQHRKITKENYKGFYGLYNQFIAHHMATYWAADYLRDKFGKQHNIAINKLDRAWVYNEKVIPRVEQLLDRTLRWVANTGKVPAKLGRVLTWDELTAYINNGELPSTKTLRARNQLAVLSYANSRYALAAGQKARQIMRQLQTIKKTAKITGTASVPGRAKGIVQVISKIADLKKFKPGRILVTPMTRPTFNPALKKAKAIITDEGGLLCHAAILAREFNIPCIIGTKNATRVLKDGDLVEVDADKGIVKIL